MTFLRACGRVSETRHLFKQPDTSLFLSVVCWPTSSLDRCRTLSLPGINPESDKSIWFFPWSQQFFNSSKSKNAIASMDSVPSNNGQLSFVQNSVCRRFIAGRQGAVTLDRLSPASNITRDFKTVTSHQTKIIHVEKLLPTQISKIMKHSEHH